MQKEIVDIQSDRTCVNDYFD